MIYTLITACKVVSLITLGSYSDCLTPTYADANAFDFSIAHTRRMNVVLGEDVYIDSQIRYSAIAHAIELEDVEKKSLSSLQG